MKSTLMTFSIYYLYLELEGKKTEEVRKHIPTAKDWDKKVLMYANKSKRELMRIPKVHREKYSKLMGKVVGEFTCDYIRKGKADNLGQAYIHNDPDVTRLSDQELVDYANKGKPVYFLHISDLKIYDTPKELYEYLSYKKHKKCLELDCFGAECWGCENNAIVVFPPQSFNYVEV